MSAGAVLSCAGPQTARGRRVIGDGGFAGMRLSQVMPALPPIGPRRNTGLQPRHPAADPPSAGAAYAKCQPVIFSCSKHTAGQPGGCCKSMAKVL